MVGLIILTAIAVTIIFLYVKYYIASEIYRASCLKGYPDKKYFWISFFVSTTGCLLVIALPNRSINDQQQTEELPEL